MCRLITDILQLSPISGNLNILQNHSATAKYETLQMMICSIKQFKSMQNYSIYIFTAKRTETEIGTVFNYT